MFRSSSIRIALSAVLALVIWSGALFSIACGPPSKKTIQNLDNAARIVINEIDTNATLPDQLLALKVITADQLTTVRKFITDARAGAVKAESFLSQALTLENPSLKALAPIIADIIAQFRGLNALVKHEMVTRFFGAVELGLRVLGSYFALQISQARGWGHSDREIMADAGFRFSQKNQRRFTLLAIVYDGKRFDEFAAALP